MDRVEVARRGGRGFVSKSLPPADVLEAVAGLLERLEARLGDVLAVDDDPAVLAALDALLRPLAVHLTPLGDPLRFWDVLEKSPPDLLILDVEMPSVSGIELCRVVRNDPRWAGIPVIFLTSHTDTATVHRVFASGADDFVAKPIIGPELVTRIRNRLDRTRLLRSAAEVDPLSGLINRPKARRTLEDFLRLAAHHGQPLGFAVLAVDKLGELNEEHGAAAGDEVLRWLGRRLRSEFHSEEVTARWGANDFVTGLYGLDRQGSLRRLEEIFEAARNVAFAGAGGEEFHITMSGGVAEYPEDGGDLQTLRTASTEALRRALAQGGNRLSLAAPERPASPGLTSVDVALVTGDEALAALVLHALEAAGFRARAIRNGRLAGRILAGLERSLRARMVLLDLDLSGMDGLALLEQLARDGSRCIVISSALSGHDAATTLEHGAEDHVAKPIDVPVLVERVRQTLSTSHGLGSR